MERKYTNYMRPKKKIWIKECVTQRLWISRFNLNLLFIQCLLLFVSHACMCMSAIFFCSFRTLLFVHLLRFQIHQQRGEWARFVDTLTHADSGQRNNNKALAKTNKQLDDRYAQTISSSQNFENMKLEMVDVKSEDSLSCDGIDDNSTKRSAFGLNISRATVSIHSIPFSALRFHFII